MLLHTTGAFFEGAKNAAAPNLTGKEGLLAGTAFLFSTRFLLMAVGSALGGWASAAFGYHVAFVINAASFLASAYSVWLIPEEATRSEETARRTVSSKAVVGIPESPLSSDTHTHRSGRHFLRSLRRGFITRFTIISR